MNYRVVKLSQNSYWPTRPVRLLPRLLTLLALLTTLAASAGLSSCASHRSLSQKTRWYKHHSGGKSLPCPCGH